MKKYLLLFIMTMCSISVLAEWRQCRNCGKHYDTKGDGSEYCARNVCQKAYRKERAEENKKNAQGAAYFRKLRAQAKKDNDDAMRVVKSNASVEEKMKALKKATVWANMVIAYGDMALVQSCWPSPKNNAVYERSKKYKGYVGSAFSFGKHKKTGKTRYVNPRTYFDGRTRENIQEFEMIARFGRADILEYFIGQMDGVNCFDLELINNAFAKVNNQWEEEKNTVKQKLKDLENRLANAADDQIEAKLKKEIGNVKVTLAKLNKRTISPELLNSLLKHVDDKVLEQYAIEADKENDRLFKLKQKLKSCKQKNYLQNNRVYNSPYNGHLTYDIEDLEKEIKSFTLPPTIFAFSHKRFEKYQNNFAAIKRFSWKPGLPNVKKVGVLAGEKEGTWVAAPGFVMQKDGSAKWQAGLKHPKFKIVSTSKIFHWLPEKEHFWFESADPYCLKAGTVGEIAAAHFEGLNKRR